MENTIEFKNFINHFKYNFETYVKVILSLLLTVYVFYLDTGEIKFIDFTLYNLGGFLGVFIFAYPFIAFCHYLIRKSYNYFSELKVYFENKIEKRKTKLKNQKELSEISENIFNSTGIKLDAKVYDLNFWKKINSLENIAIQKLIVNNSQRLVHIMIPNPNLDEKAYENKLAKYHSDLAKYKDKKTWDNYHQIYKEWEEGLSQCTAPYMSSPPNEPRKPIYPNRYGDYFSYKNNEWLEYLTTKDFKVVSNLFS